MRERERQAKVENGIGFNMHELVVWLQSFSFSRANGGSGGGGGATTAPVFELFRVKVFVPAHLNRLPPVPRADR